MCGIAGLIGIADNHLVMNQINPFHHQTKDIKLFITEKYITIWN